MGAECSKELQGRYLMTELSFTAFSATTNPCAFNLYTTDTQFQADADKLVYFIQRTLGTPVVESELDLRQIWSAFEQATIEYGATINSYHAKNILLDLMGKGTGTLSGSEQSLPLGNSVEFARKYALQYSHEFGVGQSWPWYTGSVDLVADQQNYNILAAISGTGLLTGSNANQLIQVRKIHHYESVAAYRFFDTTSVMNYMANAMNFASYSPETIFYLLPIWEDVLRGTQLQLNQRVRRSNYSFDMKGYNLTVYPVPSRSQKLYFEWTVSKTDDNMNNTIGGVSLHRSVGVTSNISNAAFGHIGYKDINSIGRTWIWNMTLAFCKEMLANIRGKYGSLPVPEGSITLNTADLLSQAQREMENLRQTLRELLEQMSYKTLMQDRIELEDLQQRTLARIPLGIFISR